MHDSQGQVGCCPRVGRLAFARCVAEDVAGQTPQVTCSAREEALPCRGCARGRPRVDSRQGQLPDAHRCSSSHRHQEGSGGQWPLSQRQRRGPASTLSDIVARPIPSHGHVPSFRPRDASPLHLTLSQARTAPPLPWEQNPLPGPIPDRLNPCGPTPCSGQTSRRRISSAQHAMDCHGLSHRHVR